APPPQAHPLPRRAARRRGALHVAPGRMRLHSGARYRGHAGTADHPGDHPRMSEAAFTDLIDLAAERLGGAVLLANDEFFAPKENLLKPLAPVFIEGKYTDLGKWMDGWETRRRRTPGFDWCIVRLGLPGMIRGVVVDTSHF